MSKAHTNAAFEVEKGSLMVTQVVMFLLQMARKKYCHVSKPSRGEFVPNGRLFCKKTETVFGRQRKKTSHVY